MLQLEGVVKRGRYKSDANVARSSKRRCKRKASEEPFGCRREGRLTHQRGGLYIREAALHIFLCETSYVLTRVYVQREEGMQHNKSDRVRSQCVVFRRENRNVERAL